jgi:membrane fusion protein (multidrug efflux system)
MVSIKAVSQQDCDDAVGTLKGAEADVEATRAALETARINLAYTRVTSPISGRIGKSSVTVGALVTASQSTALSTVQQLDPIYVNVTQSITQMLRLKQNLASGRLKSDGLQQAKVALTLEDGTRYPLEGTLKFSDVTVDQTTGSLTLRAVFPNPDHLLLPGMYVRAVLEEGVNEEAILAPQQGVTRDPRGNATALVVSGEDTVEQRTLEIARAIGDKWLVSEGLRPDDRLIVEGLQKVQPGMPVKAVVVEATASAGAGTGAGAGATAPAHAG